MDDAPLPPKITPDKIIEKMTDINEYILFIDESEYNAKIGKLEDSSKIIFKLEEISEINDYYYKSDFSLDDFKRMSKVFRIFDTITEAFNEINEMFKSKSVYLEKDSNDIILHLSISNVFSLKEDISLKIKKEMMNKEQSNELLFQSVNQMRETTLKDKKRFENLETRIVSLEESLKEEKQKTENLQKTINELKNIIEGMKYCYEIDSNIIKTKSEYNLIYNRLISHGIFKNKNPKFNLIYRASRDGDDPKDYNNKCQGKKNTICIIQTKKGCIFGGFTKTIMDFSAGQDLKDSTAFVFSIDKMKIYENKKKEYSAVCHSKNWGPIFRNEAFAVWDKKFFSYNKHKVGTISSSNFGKMDSDYELNNGEEFFSIKELEVFEIL